ncbi:hypothetical protein SAMN05660909_01509 [Chitinophaga terrae (ex Kim and Jung 2007)]|jgi:hypothetical protein|uniref:DUF4138 domain-containing protein n=1 Tax=Chitinophaga terrae (ex Kim and Jung 2007) TaxID=408074 RepID=A0A1H4A744_9BACT|nr:hypothetical protein [Chitinophaga terrae (ex Kim and Jung 2007)]MDQ0105993.1 hypothetical protein [Chitinophaga terrae (ex Kim and Jung 2007)]SEA31720.1 hypothetical protein SAMN05660909_01509 [Chitinophaga terrae (ex Kim and Jung 2007)]
MKAKTNILRSFSLSCLLVGALVCFALNALANNNFLPSDNNKDKVKKEADGPGHVISTAIPRTKLSLDGGFRFSGAVNSAFKLTTLPHTDYNVINFKTIITYTKGNVTYVVPYNVQVQNQPPGNGNFQKLQIILPLKKG